MASMHHMSPSVASNPSSEMNLIGDNANPMLTLSSAPGLDALYSVCSQIYTDQPNPLQVTAFIKYWLGGPDPLDYISMYSHPGIPELHIPPHWHYISFGLTDLHGDGRVHEPSPGPDFPSGFGFELTFRLQKPERQGDEGDTPPTWPAALLQALAKYVFHTGNSFFAGDHVSWHCPLDGSDFECKLQHMLLADDLLLPSVQGSLGSAKFLQVVAVTDDELQAAQQWNGASVLDLLRRVPAAGGPWLVTNMQRQLSLFELQPSLRHEMEQGIDRDGCSLSGVSARCHWEERKVTTAKWALGGSAWRSPETEEDDEEDGSDGSSSPDDEAEEDEEQVGRQGDEIWPIRRLHKGVHVTLNLEAASLMPVVLRGRLRHDRHFTFKAVASGGVAPETAVTLLTGKVGGALASPSAPLVAKGPWLQILVDGDWLAKMELDLAPLQQPDTLVLPKTWCWGERQMALTVVADDL